MVQAGQPRQKWTKKQKYNFGWLQYSDPFYTKSSKRKYSAQKISTSHWSMTGWKPTANHPHSFWILQFSFTIFRCSTKMHCSIKIRIFEIRLHIFYPPLNPFGKIFSVKLYVKNKSVFPSVFTTVLEHSE